MQPDEETGSAEEQPASNMVVPKLGTKTYREPSLAMAPDCFTGGVSAKKT
jgi:hypothetical protein